MYKKFLLNLLVLLLLSSTSYARVSSVGGGVSDHFPSEITQDFTINGTLTVTTLNAGVSSISDLIFNSSATEADPLSFTVNVKYDYYDIE